MYEGMTRQWEPHPRYEDLMVSNYGDVCNTTTSHILTPTETGSGKYQVKLVQSSDRKRIPLYVHRLVAEVFLKDFDQSMCVIFIDGNPANFALHNLEMSHKMARPPVDQGEYDAA